MCGKYDIYLRIDVLPLKAGHVDILAWPQAENIRSGKAVNKTLNEQSLFLPNFVPLK